MLPLPTALFFSTLLTLTAAQGQSNSNPTAVVPSTYVPILIPTGTSLAASVITAAPDGNQYVMALQCHDDNCASDPPATVSLSLSSKGPGSYTFAWTAKGNKENSTSYACPLINDPNATIDCTVALNGITATAAQYHSYPMSNFLYQWPSGIGEPVQITKGIEMLPFSSLACGSTSCNANQVITPPGDGNAPTLGGASMGSASASATATATGTAGIPKVSAASSAASSVAAGSATASSTAQATGGAKKIVGEMGAAMAAVAFVGAVAL